MITELSSYRMTSTQSHAFDVQEKYQNVLCTYYNAEGKIPKPSLTTEYEG